MERWPSGLRQRFAKPLTGLNPSGGSNPPLSASCTTTQIRDSVIQLRSPFVNCDDLSGLFRVYTKGVYTKDWGGGHSLMVVV